MFIIVRGERPELPQYARDHQVLSTLIPACWAKEPRKRPSMSEVCYRFGLVKFTSPQFWSIILTTFQYSHPIFATSWDGDGIAVNPIVVSPRQVPQRASSMGILHVLSQYNSLVTVLHAHRIGRHDNEQDIFINGMLRCRYHIDDPYSELNRQVTDARSARLGSKNGKRPCGLLLILSRGSTLPP